MRKHTVLLVFIHGFKGDDGTFSDFPEYLQSIIQHQRPHLDIKVAKYPQYETRGDLKACVSRFRGWLQDTIIDLEVAAGTPSPTVDPWVHTILVGHSMGGIVGADTILDIMNDPPVGSSTQLQFPHIIGMLAFDTPYLGLSPSMFAHGAEDNWKTASTAFSSISSVASGLFATQAASAAQATAVATTTPSATRNHDPRPSSASSREKKDEPQSLWGKWGKVAALGGAAAALAGGAAAAYIKREDLASGFTWVSSHLEFVGALMKGEELKNRVETVSNQPTIGFANLFTSLGERFGSATFFDGKERTFCSIPDANTPLRKKFYRCINSQAKDEVGAHVAMFQAKTNPGYYDMTDRAKSLISFWVPEEAYPPVEEDSEDEYRRRRKSEKRRDKGRFDEFYSEPRGERRKSKHSSTHDLENEKPSRRSSKHSYEKHDYGVSDAGVWESERGSTSEPRFGEERRRSRHGTPVRTHSFEAEQERERRGSRSSRHTPSRMYSEPEPLVRRESDRMEKERRREKRGSPKVDLDYNPWR